MRQLDISDIVTRLRVLRTYSPELSRRMDHEGELPEDAGLFLIEKIETLATRCATASAANRADILEELSEWLIRSYRYYLARLAMAEIDNVWCFEFPKTESYVRH